MNPDGQMRLSDSVKLFGLCTDMCPEFERVRRIVEEDVKAPECTPETQHLPRRERTPDETRMVKAYTRSAAGMDVELVSEIRSPATCLRTIDYLMKRLDGDTFDFLHSWIWDRTRSIRKDLRTQRIEQRTDINILLQCLERCARFLLLAAHQMARSAKEDYTHQQDIEQLNATLISLQERYVDNRRVGYPSENEAEFWAYRLILAPLFKNSHLEDQLHGLPNDLRNNRRVQTAIEIFRTLKSIIFTDHSSFVQSQANWKRFWDLIKSPSVSYLMACAAEVSFQRVRHVVLDGIWRSYRKGAPSRPQQVDAWKPDMLREVLGFDTTNEAVKLCEAYGFQFQSNQNNQTFLDVTGKGFVKSPLPMGTNLKPQEFSNGIVEVKRYGRAFSAIVQALSVREATVKGLMVNSAHEQMGDQNSLFIPETTTNQPNPFMGGAPANPFLPNTAATTASAPAVNPFLPAQSNTFNSATDAIKFAPTAPASIPFGNLGNSTLFGATSNATASNSSAFPKPGATSNENPFLAFKKASEQQPAVTPTSATPPQFGLPTSGAPEGQAQTSTPPFSFTPAGSPAPSGPSPQDEEKKKADEEEKRKKAAAEALAQQQRAREEEARQAKAQAEQKRLQDEEQRNRVAQQARERAAQKLQEERERKAREEEARTARLRAKDAAWDALATDAMLDTNDGLLLQFLENFVIDTATEVVAAEKEAKKKALWEKKKGLANAMYEQRMLGMKRLVMATWLAKIEKKRRAEQARARRRRLKEHKAQKSIAEDVPSDLPTPAASETSVAPVTDDASFQKPQVPASARRAKRMEERRGTRTPHLNGGNDTAQQAATQAILTPASTNDGHTDKPCYSEAYKRSTAPVDRTETEYFHLLAQGLDPSKIRKRTLEASSSDNTPQLEAKRPRIAQPTNERPMPPSATAHADIAARLQAVQESLRKSGGSPQAPHGTTAIAKPSSTSSRRQAILEQAKQALGKGSSSNASPPSTQHDWSRSVPNLAMSTTSARRSMLNQSTNAVLKDDRPAYWARKSRFVPQHLYGQGPDAVRAYREQYGLNSPAASRGSTTEPPAVSSPIPIQQSYMPQNGYTHEQCTVDEDADDIEIIDVDAEDEDVETTEEEYEGDEESEEEQGRVRQPDQLQRSQSHQSQNYDEDGDSEMSDQEVHDNGFANGQYAQSAGEALDDYEGYSDEEDEEDEEEDEEDESEDDTMQQPQYFAQPPRFQSGKPAPQMVAGSTEDDAIELSD